MKQPKAKAAGSEVKEKGAAEVMMEKLEVLKGMSTKQLVEYAKKEFKAEFNIGNGRPWLYKKAAYLEQERVNGNKGNAAVRAAKLDEPKEIEKAKKQAEKEIVKTEEKSKRGKALSSKSNGAKDEDGFRVDSKGSAMFALLKKGCKISELEKVGGKAIAGFLNGIKLPVGDWSAGRGAVIERKDDFIKIKSYSKKS